MNPFGVIIELLRRPVVGVVLIVGCLFNFAFNGRNSVLAVFAIDRFAVSPSQLAVLFVIGGIAMVIVQGVLVARFVERLSPLICAYLCVSVSKESAELGSKSGSKDRGLCDSW